MHRTIVAVLTAASAALTSGWVIGLAPGDAHACSCASIDPVDAIARADTVFTGTAVANEGTHMEPRWRFEVDGVVKGDVDPVEVVAAEDWAVGCGTDFDAVHGSVAVFARRTEDGLAAMGCMSAPTAGEFAGRLADAARPGTGKGPPSAVLVGRVGFADLAVLDGRGRALARGDLGIDHGVVAHCPGTTLVAIATSDPERVEIVDLATFEAVEERPIDSGWLFATDGIVCLDGGARVVTAAGFAPNEGEIRVATSDASGDHRAATFTEYSRAVPHADGTVLLIPRRVGDPLRALSSSDLESIDGELELPDGTSVTAGAVSPDGSTLAMLATRSGRPVEYDTGATHVMLVRLEDGIPVEGSLTSFEIGDPGATYDDARGAAKQIGWLDGDTLAIERETASAKILELVATDGEPVLVPTDIDWGWGMVPVPTGLLRMNQGGVEVVGVDGVVTPGDPAPAETWLDRFLSIAPLVEVPELDIAVADPIEPLTIRPVGTEPPSTANPAISTATTEPPTAPATAPADASPADASPAVDPSESPAAPATSDPAASMSGWAIAGVAVVVILVAALLGGAVIVRS